MEEQPDQGAYRYHRRRRVHVKVKTGCGTCKIRRVKCDEGRPSCNKCVSTGRKCDGYAHLLSSSPSSSVALPEPRDSISSTSQLSRGISPPARGTYPQWERTENEYFHFLLDTASLKLNDGFDGKLWLKDIFRVAQIYPAVWHAVISLAAALKCDIQGLQPSTEDVLLKQSNFAMRELCKFHNERLNRNEKYVILTTAILFAYRCQVMGATRGSFVHIDSAMKLYQSWFPDSASVKTALATDSSQVLGFLAGLFARLDSRARVWVTCHYPYYELPALELYQAFESPQQACSELEVVFNGVLRDNAKQSSRSEQCTALLVAWDKKLNHFIQSDYGKAPEFADELCTLRIRRTLVQIILGYDPGSGEIGWDNFLPEFTAIIALAEQCGESKGSRSDPQNEQWRQLTLFSVGYIDALLTTACRCRHPAIRQRALNLLAAQRTDGTNPNNWFGHNGVNYARSLVQMEEYHERGTRQCCPPGSICNAHRITSVHIEYSSAHGEGYPQTSWCQTEGWNGMAMHIRQRLTSDLPAMTQWDWLGLRHSWSVEGSILDAQPDQSQSRLIEIQDALSSPSSDGTIPSPGYNCVEPASAKGQINSVDD